MALVRLISRKSKLALIQADEVSRAIKQADPSLHVEIVTVSSNADRAPNRRIEDFETTGVFTKALEDALLDGAGDCAVHSAKDLPSTVDDRFSIAAYLPRADRRDALVYKAPMPRLDETIGATSAATSASLVDAALRTGSVIATGSPRRRAQLARMRPDLLFCDLRGNIERRLSALNTADAVVVGACALDRLGISPATSPDIEIIRLDEDWFVPAAGQGAIAVETLRDGPFSDLWEEVNDIGTSVEVSSERAFLAGLRAGCTAPVGVTASTCRSDAGGVTVSAVVCSRDGHRSLSNRVIVSGFEEAIEAGRHFGVEAIEVWSAESDLVR
jgi:hydroxymethylbilane synthase